MKKPTVIKCYRCQKRCRNPEFWNIETVAGLDLGALCPDCQTVEEYLGAEINLAMGTTHGLRQLPLERPGAVSDYIDALLDAYPTPDVMRSKADKIAAARSDQQATEVVRLMRRLADKMHRADLGRLLERIQEQDPAIATTGSVPLALAMERVATVADDGSLTLNLDNLGDDEVAELYGLASAVAAELDGG